MATKCKDTLLSSMGSRRGVEEGGGTHWLTKTHQRPLDNDSLIQFKSHTVLLFTLTNEQAGQYGKYRFDRLQSL